MIRLFLALSIPDTLRTALAAACCGVPGVRWSPPENYHLTLRFVDEIDEGLAEDLDAALVAHFSQQPVAAFSLSVHGMGAFGHGHRMRQVWAAVAPSPPLLALKSSVETVCQAVGLPAEGRHYTPHITLGTVTERPPSPRFGEMVASHADWQPGCFPVDALTLYRSLLGNGCPVYQALTDYALVPQG